MDLAANGVRAVSFGGGEPLEYSPIFELLDALRGVLPRTLTTNGLPLERAAAFERLVRAAPEKVHVSIHAPENLREVARVVDQVLALGKRAFEAALISWFAAVISTRRPAPCPICIMQA
jgi:molybdenum cofactor biosynthesis enzyme MoaA